MVARSPFHVPSPVAQAAWVANPRPAKAPEILTRLRELARQESALSLRLGMVLACIRSFDVSELGYSGFGAFCRERVDWGGSWIRAVVRLVESPLDEVKAAAAAGRLPLRLAVTAPGKVAVHQQTEWIDGAAVAAPPRLGPRARFRARDADVVAEARELARVCLGSDAPLSQLDAYILRHWHDRVPGKALDEGRTPPPPPEPREPDFRWAAISPAESLLGPWQAPKDLHAAVAQLDAVQAARRGRWSELARGFARVHFEALWRPAGYDSAWEFAEQELGWSRRTAQRYRKLGWALEWYPQLEAAVCAGLPPEAASRIGWFAQDDTGCNRLIELARHLGPHDLKAALADGGERLGDYERAVALAKRHAEVLLGPEGPTARPSGVTAAFHVARCLGDESDASGRPVDDPNPPSPAGDGPATDAIALARHAEFPDADEHASRARVEGPAPEGGREHGGATHAGTPPPDARQLGGATRAGTPPPDARQLGGATHAGTPPPDARQLGGATHAGTHGAGSGAQGTVPLRVALVPAPPVRAACVWGHPHLVEAARWFVAHNTPRPLSGFAACKERARYRCENPECGRVTLRVEAHHVHWRRHGGSDDPDNGVALCPSCHLRNVHTREARIRVSRVMLEGIEARLWEYPGRPPVLQLREPPPRPPVPAWGARKGP